MLPLFMHCQRRRRSRCHARAVSRSFFCRRASEREREGERERERERERESADDSSVRSHSRFHFPRGFFSLVRACCTFSLFSLSLSPRVLGVMCVSRSAHGRHCTTRRVRERERYIYKARSRACVNEPLAACAKCLVFLPFFALFLSLVSILFFARLFSVRVVS